MPITWDDEKPKEKGGIVWDDEQQKVATPTESPTLGQTLFGDATAGDYLKGRVEDIKKIADPETWRTLGRELTQPLPPLGNKLMDSKPGPSKYDINDAIGLVASIGPTTAMSKSVSTLLAPQKTGADLVKQKTLEMAGEAGYSVPRSNIKQTVLTNLGERFGGKQAIEATAQMKNQPITNQLAAKALGLADDAPITPEVLKGIRTEAGKAYEAVSNIGTLMADKKYFDALRDVAQNYSGASKDFPELASEGVMKLAQGLNKEAISSQGAVEMIKNLRQQASSNLGHASTAQDKLLGRAQKAAADALDDLIERNIEPALGKGLLDSYRAARQLIAKTHTVENALNEATGNVVATELVRAAHKGVPLSGELKKIANFSSAFPRLSREPIGAPASGGLFEPLVYGTTGGMAAGPAGAAAAAVPIIGKPIARRVMTTVPKPQVPIKTGALDNFILQRLMLGGANADNN